MPKFKVVYESTAFIKAEVIIEAENRDEAWKMAEDSREENLEWQIDNFPYWDERHVAEIYDEDE